MSKVWEDWLAHIGNENSGRYPRGSGENPYQHESSWLARSHDLRRRGLSDKEIAEAMGLSTREWKAKRAAEIQARDAYQNSIIRSMCDRGMSDTEIGRELGMPTSTVASRRAIIYNTERKSVTEKRQHVIDILKEQLKNGEYLEVGHGVADQIGCTDSMLVSAMKALEKEGYKRTEIQITSATDPDHKWKTPILVAPDAANRFETEKALRRDIYLAKDADKLLYFDGKATIDKESGEIRKIQYPASIDSKRVAVRYADDDGVLQDGTIEIRRNVADLSLGNSRYAQVRILVDGDHYLKGMAHYADDLPDGVDIRFNTNKKSGTPKVGPDNDHSVLKCIDKSLKDNLNPFGAYYSADGQSEYDGADGKKHLSAINKLRKEGEWDEQRVRVPSQMLSKQSKQLVRSQLKETLDDYRAEFDAIRSNTNPIIRQKLLEDFGDKCETASYELAAKKFPKQRTQVIMPIVDISEHEVFAPNFDNGTTVALIRYPHGSTSEIPILKVNNNNKEGVRVYGKQARDMVGINSKVASKLSGADFDGDTVSVIPLSSKVHITSSDQMEGLKDYDPHTKYAGYPGMKRLAKKNTGREMGKITNLITDMHVRGADLDDIEKAIKHSMVVIDAAKHNLDYKQSEIDNDIEYLKKRYQSHNDPITGEYQESGASTLLSLAKNPTYIDKTRGSGHIDPKTGVKWYEKSNQLNQKGEPKQQKTYKMLVVDDARKLSTGTEVEELYANFANSLKAMTNQARKESVNTKLPKKDPIAEKTYEYEVASINAKLNEARKNAPKERHANSIAESIVRQKKEEYPAQFKGEENKKAARKLAQTELEAARARLGSKSYRFSLTDKEFEAIQANALSATKVKEVFRYIDTDDFAAKTMPKSSNSLSKSQQSRLTRLVEQGYTPSDIAESLRVPISTVDYYLYKKED